jgi:hypothetical protein
MVAKQTRVAALILASTSLVLMVRARLLVTSTAPIHCRKARHRNSRIANFSVQKFFPLDEMSDLFYLPL